MAKSTLRLGDQIRIGISANVELAKYTFLKAQASVTREIKDGDDVEIITVEMETEARRLLARATLLELNALSDYTEAVQQGGVEGLINYCMKEIDHGNPRNDGSTTTDTLEGQARLEGQAKPQSNAKPTPRPPPKPKPKG
jgi:hypothetical protein